MSEWSWDPDPGGGIRNRWVEANGLRFEVAEAGEGDHLALLLHGFPELNFSWRHQMPLLAGLGYRVWAPNQRGYGKSSKPAGIDTYSADRIVADAAALIDASGAKTVTLIAHDWGGAIAWQFAIKRVRPLARLVVMNCPHPACFAREIRTWKQLRKSWYMFLFQLPKLPEYMLTRDGARAVRHAFLDSAANPQHFPPSDLEIYARAALEPGAMTAMVNWYRAAARHRTLTTSREYPPIEVPTLIIWGENDMALDLATLDDTDRYVRDLTVRRLPRISHWVQNDDPAQVNAILREWLST